MRLMIYNFAICLYVILRMSFAYGMTDEYIPGHAIVTLKSGSHISALKSLNQEFGVYAMEPLVRGKPDSIDKKFGLDRVWLFKFLEDKQVSDFIERYSANPNIESVDPDHLCKLYKTPNDPYFSSQWNLTRIEAPQGWDYQTGDPSVVIAVVDGGCDWNHPDLKNNIWVNPGEDIDGDGVIFDTDDLNDVDDDNNGYVDDLIGWDWTTNDNDPTPTYGGEFHGTWCNGIANACTDNSRGIAGVAFNCKSIAFRCTASGNPGAISIWAAINAMRYARTKGACVISCSWGSYSYNSSLNNAIQSAYDAGLVICAAGGNENISQASYPPAYENVIGVGATNQSDRKSSYSNYGWYIDVCAPGDGIYGCTPGGGYTSQYGTSASCPEVAGLVALVKCSNPGASNTTIENIIFSACDSIDHLNPGYEGQLGYGRINVYNAIAGSNYPKLTYYSQSVYEVEGDGDSLINPGETMEFNVVIQNSSGWADALGVTGVVQSPSPYIVMIDSTSSYGDILSGSTGSNSTRFKAQILSETTPSIIPFELIISANQSTPYPYSDTIEFGIEVTLNQFGWPVNLGTGVSSPAIVDIDNDGEQEIIAGDLRGNVWVWNYRGVVEAGFPVKTGNQIQGAPAIGDVDNNGTLEIVVGSKDDTLYIIEPDGAIGLKFGASNYLMGTPTLADLDNNGDLEIIFGDFSGNLYVINHDGTQFGPFPYQLDGAIIGGVAVGDVDADNVLDIAVGTYNKKLYVISSNGDTLTGWPNEVSGQIWAPPSIADFNEDEKLEVVCGCADGNLYVFDYQGNPLNVLHAGGNLKGAPSFCDIDGDGLPEIFCGSTNGKIYAFKSYGDTIPGFPYSTGGSVTSPIFSDMDGNGKPEVVFGAGDGKLYLLYQDATPITCFPVNTGSGIQSSPSIDDLDGDSDLEIGIGNNTGMEVIDFKAKGGDNRYWNTYRGNLHRTGNYKDVLTGVNEDVVQGFSLAKVKLTCFPNPFTNKTVISAQGLGRGLINQTPTLQIYDLTGRLVKSLPITNYQLPITVVWDGTNEKGDKVACGIYFYRLEVSGFARGITSKTNLPRRARLTTRWVKVGKMLLIR
ncbi:MAG: S8 family serine peptidase [bacterium]|nr:S8 family serine peptidase [bacterium]